MPYCRFARTPATDCPSRIVPAGQGGLELRRVTTRQADAVPLQGGAEFLRILPRCYGQSEAVGPLPVTALGVVSGGLLAAVS